MPRLVTMPSKPTENAQRDRLPAPNLERSLSYKRSRDVIADVRTVCFAVCRYVAGKKLTSCLVSLAFSKHVKYTQRTHRDVDCAKVLFRTVSSTTTAPADNNRHFPAGGLISLTL